MNSMPHRGQLIHASSAAWAAVRDPRAVSWLTEYYDPAGNYAGSILLDLSLNDPFNLTATDLYALSTLDVRATPLAGRRLLQSGVHRDRVLAALGSTDLPKAADLLTANDVTFGAAEELYLAIRDAHGHRPWVTASKLCARKRPHFYPIRDSVVTQILLRLGKSYVVDWKVYRHLLADQELMARLLEVVELAYHRSGIAILDPPLRVLDVLLWRSVPSDLRRRRPSRP